ncbi:chromo domain-containing protein [Colletotrichum salicis]|uniref:Chromo domain-containing protein n=1 Tax=Colletotrichum salicis TaxID=1209931 RepID=A0A135V5M3_9PEZI|nr:chromo domain-containing protein [Colletotrichum salicis]
MSAPLVFKGQELAMTQNELAASSAAAKVNGAENEDEDEPIPKVESDLAEPAGAPEKSAGRKRQSSQPAGSKASKRRKLLEGQEPLAESSQSVQASIENQLSSQYAAPETASPADRSATKTGKLKKAAPAAKKALPLDASDFNEGNGPDDHGPSHTERDDASPPPVQAPKKRGRPRKTPNAVSGKYKKPAGPVTKATTLRRSTRASTIEKAVPEKKNKVLAPVYLIQDRIEADTMTGCD